MILRGKNPKGKYQGYGLGGGGEDFGLNFIINCILAKLV